MQGKPQHLTVHAWMQSRVFMEVIYLRMQKVVVPKGLFCTSGGWGSLDLEY